MKKREWKKEKQDKKNARNKKKNKLDKIGSTYRIFSRLFCNFVFPNEDVEGGMLKRPMPRENQNLKQTINTTNADKELDEDLIDAKNSDDIVDNMDGRYETEDNAEINDKIKELTDVSYKDRINKALKLLKENADKFLSTEGLTRYGPKFLRMLSNIENPKHTGLHLIYSQFRTLEGIGIFKLILEHNGYVEFKIKKNDNNEWTIDIKDEDKGKPTFALYTGEEELEEKEIIRYIFNGEWNKIPTSLNNELTAIDKNNNYGNIIKIFMITSSGAEGITLKNVRHVHITEPYWHPVRSEQVIGRARRICSHKDLIPEDRTVKTFLYLMTFSKFQLKGNPDAEDKKNREPLISKELNKKDKGKLKDEDGNIRLVTTDESLHEISTIKKNTNNNLLNAIKSSSIDCNLHNNSKSGESYACYIFNAQSNDEFSSKPSYAVDDSDTVEKLNKKKILWEGYELTINNQKYTFRPLDDDPKNKKLLIGSLYDYDSYKQSLKTGSNPIFLRKLIPDPNDPKKRITQ